MKDEEDWETRGGLNECQRVSVGNAVAAAIVGGNGDAVARNVREGKIAKRGIASDITWLNAKVWPFWKFYD